ncbi:MAG: hypothetical protein HRU75_10190 [Planctomycetia bacterium]|nr:MAG: hypothetical protein HRU75_10190 [Planctomycetia bacterium]
MNPALPLPPPGSDAERLIGARTGGWRLASLVAVGAMGWVYEARRDPPAGTDEPLRIAKVLRPGLNHAALRRRFGREWRIQRLARGPGVPQIIARAMVGWNAAHADIKPASADPLDIAADGPPPHLPCFVMSHAPGSEMISIGRRGAPLSPRAVRRVIRRIAAVVERVHAVGIAHGDIKPQNVIISPSLTANTIDDVHLIDFGVARVIEPPRRAERLSGEIEPADQVCTPQYASPQRLDGGGATFSCDQYALCAVAYELLTGAPPHPRGGRAFEQYRRSIREQRPTPLMEVCHIPKSGEEESCLLRLNAAILRGLSQDASDRHASIAALIEALGTGD